MGAGHAHPAALTGAEGTRAGLRAIWIAAIALGVSAVARLVVAFLSGSVGLLAAGLDDLGDVLTTIALSIAFVASRRAADRRYTFGYQRFEDLSGVLVVLVIWSSAAYATFEAVRKLGGDHAVDRIGLAIVAAAAGLIANGFAGFYKIGVGKRIGSQPLIADGKHALTDGIASIAAVAGLLGVRSGAEWADPVAALVVVLAIVWVAIQATRNVLRHLLDAVDPAVIDTIEGIARRMPGVEAVGRCQARWAGRSLYVSLTIAVDEHMTIADAHDVAEHLHHQILHDMPGVAQVDVHLDPGEPHGPDAHDHTAAHAAQERGEHVHSTHHEDEPADGPTHEH
ncbi:MAG TPA: cation diffusion facilitator family transporter [Actinomycetota bacterium]